MVMVARVVPVPEGAIDAVDTGAAAEPGISEGRAVDVDVRDATDGAGAGLEGAETAGVAEPGKRAGAAPAGRRAASNDVRDTGGGRLDAFVGWVGVVGESAGRLGDGVRAGAGA